MKIWNKNIKTSNSSIDIFLSGADIVLDQELFLYDIEASIAHAEELKAINILNASELKKMLSALKKLAKLFVVLRGHARSKCFFVSKPYFERRKIT